MEKDNHFSQKKRERGGEKERDYLSPPMLFCKLHAAWKKEREGNGKNLIF
jgi:hypothetical protein